MAKAAKKGPRVGGKTRRGPNFTPEQYKNQLYNYLRKDPFKQELFNQRRRLPKKFDLEI